MLKRSINATVHNQIVFNQFRAFAVAGLQSNINVGKLDQYGEPRFLENVKLFLNRAAKNTNIPDDMLTFISSCKNVIRFNIPLRMDDGSIRTIPCYRAQHSTHALPTKGGTRYSEHIDL
jgi:glutamate dehydrogenase (NAD(P)+)